MKKIKGECGILIKPLQLESADLMENCLLNYYVLNDELRDSCDFNPYILTEEKGVFEVLRVINEIPLFLDEHIERFYRSAELEKLIMSFSRKKLRKNLQKLIEVNRLKNGNIRFQYLIHSQIGPLFFAWVTTAIYPTKMEYNEGVVIVSLNAFRKNPHSKRANLPVRFMAEEIIAKEDVTEVLLINKDELVTECHRSNIFFIAGKTLYTPSIELVLPGITRDKIIQLALENHIQFAEKNINVKELVNYDACFISSTSKNILPVRKLDTIYYEVSDLITNKLASLYDDFIVDHLKNFNWE